MPYGFTEPQFAKLVNSFSEIPGIQSAILFGSRAKGNYHTGSDVDIALKGDNLQLSDVLKILNFLEESEIPYTFDIIIYHSISSKELLEHINRAGIVIYHNETGK